MHLTFLFQKEDTGDVTVGTGLGNDVLDKALAGRAYLQFCDLRKIIEPFFDGCNAGRKTDPKHVAAICDSLLEVGVRRTALALFIIVPRAVWEGMIGKKGMIVLNALLEAAKAMGLLAAGHHRIKGWEDAMASCTSQRKKLEELLPQLQAEEGSEEEIEKAQNEIKRLSQKIEQLQYWHVDVYKLGKQEVPREARRCSPLSKRSSRTTRPCTCPPRSRASRMHARSSPPTIRAS